MTLQGFFKKNRFADNVGVELIEIKEGYGKARLAITEEHLNAGNCIQGGAFFALANLVLAAATNSHDTFAFPFSSNITLLRSSDPGDTPYTEARKRCTGRSIGYYQINITSQKGELVTTSESSIFRKGDTPPFAVPL